jgi:Fe-S oxidoreductase
MNCNEKSKALRYKRMLEAKTAAPILVTSCPKCEIHFECLQNDFEDIAEIQILDFSEFISDKIELTNPKTKGEKKK